MTDFLKKEGRKYSNLTEYYDGFAELYQKKLWHQLTESLSNFVLKKENLQNGNLIDLYGNFIDKFEGRMNQLKFVQIASVIAQQHLTSSPAKKTEIRDAIEFLEPIVEKRSRLGEEAYVVAQMAVAELRLQAGGEDQLETAKLLLEEVYPVIQNMAGSGSETVVSSSYYRVSSEYYKICGPADEFYKASLQFLAFTPQETLSVEMQQSLAIDMSLAALVGENVYNFGEVLAQPLLSCLDSTQYSWLHGLLSAFSQGDIDGFSNIVSTNIKAVQAQPLLASNMETLRQKMALLCLMKIIFNRPPEDRNIELFDIAEATRLQLEQVEWLLMRAMSKGLIKGKIDEVKGVVHVSWLKPRVLDAIQMDVLKDKLNKWTANVQNTLLYIESETPELFQ